MRQIRFFKFLPVAAVEAAQAKAAEAQILHKIRAPSSVALLAHVQMGCRLAASIAAP